MTTHRRFPLRAATAVCTGLLALGLAACSGDDPDDNDTATPTASPSSSPSASAPDDSPSASDDSGTDPSPDSTPTGEGSASPDAEFATFCDEALTIYQGEDLADADPSTDPAGFVVALSAMNDRIAAVEAPDEIAADWDEFQRAVDDLTTGAKGLDTSDAEAFNTALGELGDDVAPSEESQDNIDVFMTDHCGA